MDLEKIASNLIQEYETLAIQWKARADGVRLLYGKLVEAGRGREVEDSNKPTE